jgi:hypothetical protein
MIRFLVVIAVGGLFLSGCTGGENASEVKKDDYAAEPGQRPGQ